jgi:hypothetical protein
VEKGTIHTKRHSGEDPGKTGWVYKHGALPASCRLLLFQNCQRRAVEESCAIPATGWQKHSMLLVCLFSSCDRNGFVVT